MFDVNKNECGRDKKPGGGPFSQGEARLDPAAQAALAQSLCEANGQDAPASSPRFNADVLACLQNTEMFLPAGRVAANRLRWMSLPALMGFVTMYAVCGAWAHLLNAPPAPLPRVPSLAAPALPPLPTLDFPKSLRESNQRYAEWLRKGKLAPPRRSRAASAAPGAKGGLNVH